MSDRDERTIILTEFDSGACKNLIDNLVKDIKYAELEHGARALLTPSKVRDRSGKPIKHWQR